MVSTLIRYSRRPLTRDEAHYWQNANMEKIKLSTHLLAVYTSCAMDSLLLIMCSRVYVKLLINQWNLFFLNKYNFFYVSPSTISNLS